MVEVTTGGPIAAIGPIVSLEDATYSQLVVQIADEIDDTTNEYNAQIQNAVFVAIRYCERYPYYFNQTRDVTFSTVDGQEFYDGDDHEQIPDLVRIEAVYSEDAQEQRTRLLRWRPQQMEIMADGSASRGEPYAFTYFDRKLRLYPIPSEAVYSIRLQLSPYRLAPISDPSESNAWTTEAFDMIKARSKYLIYKNIIKDATLALEALNDFRDQDEALRAETSRRNGTGTVQATSF